MEGFEGFVKQHHALVLVAAAGLGIFVLYSYLHKPTATAAKKATVTRIRPEKTIVKVYPPGPHGTTRAAK